SRGVPDGLIDQLLDQQAIALEERPHAEAVIYSVDALVRRAHQIEFGGAPVFAVGRSDDHLVVADRQVDPRRVVGNERTFNVQPLQFAVGGGRQDRAAFYLANLVRPCAEVTDARAPVFVARDFDLAPLPVPALSP